MLQRLIKWLYPGMKVKRYVLIVIIGIMAFSYGVSTLVWFRVLNVEGPRDNWTALESQDGGIRSPGMMRPPAQLIKYWGDDALKLILTICGAVLIWQGIKKLNRSIVSAFLPDKEETLVDVIFKQRYLAQGFNVVALGGGHGLAMLLRGVKKHTGNVAAIVTVADDGGSSGRLRDQFDLVPPGDLRSCLIALAESEPMMKDLFDYRFSSQGSELDGHSFGNLFLLAMRKVTGDMETALVESGKILSIMGEVLPSTTQGTVLQATYEDGEVLEGESRIGQRRGHIVSLKLKDRVPGFRRAVERIENAHTVVLGPGSLYTSVIPNLLVPEIRNAVIRSRGVKIYIMNLVMQDGETWGFKASDHLKTLEEVLGAGVIDYVIIPRGANDIFRREPNGAVEMDLENLKSHNLRIVSADITAGDVQGRHDSDLLAAEVMKIVARESSVVRQRHDVAEESGAGGAIQG